MFINQAGIATSYAGAASQAVTASSTNYVYLTNGGTLTVNTTGFPSTPTLYVPLAVVVAGSSTITSIADSRVCLPVVGTGFLPLGGGTMTDGANVALGSTTGTQIGTATSQKLGFFGKTPVVQQTGGAATAGASYTSTEQGMLNAAYSAAPDARLAQLIVARLRDRRPRQLDVGAGRDDPISNLFVKRDEHEVGVERRRLQALATNAQLVGLRRVARLEPDLITAVRARKLIHADRLL